MNSKPPAGLFLGLLNRETIINAQGEVFIDQPGGNLLQAAAGFGLWEERAGLVARVGADYPAEWIEGFWEQGFDVAGVKRLEESPDLRKFTAYVELEKAEHDEAIRHFAKLNRPFPKVLLGYEGKKHGLESLKKRGILSLREEDIPNEYAGAKFAHLCAMDYFSHQLIPPRLRELGCETITMDAGRGYLHPDYWNELPTLVSGLSTFLVEESEVRTAFGGRSEDLWEMAEILCSFNCQSVVIKRGSKGAFLFDKEKTMRIRMPDYPVQAKDIHSRSSSFSGGFLAGLVQGGDFLEACAFGLATASLASEGSGAFYVLGSIKGLAESRMESLVKAAQIV